jgi:hypothetical protein
MAKKKPSYFKLKRHLKSEGMLEENIPTVAQEIYEEWEKDESQDIIKLFENKHLATAKNTEGSPEINDCGDDQISENQAEQSSAKQEEETHDQNLKDIPEYVETAEQADRKLDIDKVISEAKKEPEVRRVKPEDLENQKYEEAFNSTPEELGEAAVKEAKKSEIAKKDIVKPVKFDWEKYLEENPQFKTKDKDSGIEVLLLQFFKDIAHKEGFLSVRYSPLGNADQGYCGVSCEIEWPNLPRISSGLADAHFNNCHSFTKYYLSPMAENRSFIRAVKQYFNIPYLGKDEIGQTPKEEPKTNEAPTGPYVVLKKAAKDKLNITSFDGFKSFLRKQVKEDPDIAWLKPDEYKEWAEYNDWQEIKKPKILELINKIKG